MQQYNYFEPRVHVCTHSNNSTMASLVNHRARQCGTVFTHIPCVLDKLLLYISTTYYNSMLFWLAAFIQHYHSVL